MHACQDTDGSTLVPATSDSKARGRTVCLAKDTLDGQACLPKMMHPRIVNQQQIEANNGTVLDLFKFGDFDFQECIVHNLEFRQVS